MLTAKTLSSTLRLRPEGRSQRVQGVKDSRVRVKGYGTKTTLDYIRMLYISYGSVCELETQILLAGDLGFIEKGELGTA